jgi:hypothetical protein
MTFTDKEVLALEALRTHVPYESEYNLSTMDRTNADWFEGQARHAMDLAQDYYAMYQLVTSDNFDELKRQMQEEEVRKQKERMAARSLEVRENLVSGILSGLIPKARRAGQVEFDINDADMCIDVWQGGKRSFCMIYDRIDGTMSASINGKHLETEDWTVLGGNSRPRDQSEALRTVLDYLDGLSS